MKKGIIYIIMLCSLCTVQAQSSCEKHINTIKKFTKKTSAEKDYNVKFTHSKKALNSEYKFTQECELHRHGNSWFYADPSIKMYQQDSLSVQVLHESNLILLQTSISKTQDVDETLIDSLLEVEGQVTCEKNVVTIKPCDEHPVKTTIVVKYGSIYTFTEVYMEANLEVEKTILYKEVSFTNDNKVPENLESYFFPYGEIRKEYSNYEIKDLRTN